MIDTSVVVKWAIAEEGSDRAMLWYGGDIAAPELKAELANVLWKKVRRREAERLQAEAAYSEILTHLQFLPTNSLDRRALSISLELGHPVYDCCFLALAEALGTTIITADLRLIRTCAGSAFHSLLEPL